MLSETRLSGSFPARYRPVSASMSAHDPASSFGAPGGAPVLLGRGPVGVDQGARTSKIESAIRAAALLTRTITCSHPLHSSAFVGRMEILPARSPPTTTPTAAGRRYFAREDRRLPPPEGHILEEPAVAAAVGRRYA